MAGPSPSLRSGRLKGSYQGPQNGPDLGGQLDWLAGLVIEMDSDRFDVGRALVVRPDRLAKGDARLPERLNPCVDAQGFAKGDLTAIIDGHVRQDERCDRVPEPLQKIDTPGFSVRGEGS